MIKTQPFLPEPHLQCHSFHEHAVFLLSAPIVLQQDPNAFANLVITEPSWNFHVLIFIEAHILPYIVVYI